MTRQRWLWLPAAAMVLAACAAWGAPEGRPPTVGGFALKVWRAMGRPAADQAAAVTALRKAGVDLGKDVGADLTVGRAARILRDLGFQVTDPREPADEVSPARANQIVKVVARPNGKPSRHSGRKGRDDCPVSPSDPDDCPGDDDDDDDEDEDDDDRDDDDDDDHHGDDDDDHDHHDDDDDD